MLCFAADTLLTPCAAEGNDTAAAMLATRVFQLVRTTDCTPYAAAIKVSDSLPANLATLLVPIVHQAAVVLRLPRARQSQWSWCTWRQASSLAGVLSWGRVSDTLQAYLCQPEQPRDNDAFSSSSNAQRLLATACQLMVHMPLNIADIAPDMVDGTPCPIGLMLCSFADLLGVVCFHIREALETPMLQQQAEQLPADSPGWQSDAQCHRMAQDLVQVLPRLPTTLQLLVEGGRLRYQAVYVLAITSVWQQAVFLLDALMDRCPLTVSSWLELTAWCTARNALLRGRVLTAAVVGQYDLETKENSALSDLAAAMLDSLCLAVTAAAWAEEQHMSGFDAPLTAATAAAAETALWDLHTSFCRSAHQQTADIDDDVWCNNLDSTNRVMLSAWRLHRCVQQKFSQPTGR